MKKLLILLMLFCCFAAAACVLDDPDIADEEGEILVTEPDAGEANIITPGCDGPETDPYRVCEGDGGGGSGTGGGGGGSGGGGNCTPGQPGCSGPPTPTCAWGFYWNDYLGVCALTGVGSGSCSHLGPRVVDGNICLFTVDTPLHMVCTCYPF